MRIGILQLWQETNTFNPLPTTRREFEAFGLLRGAEIVDQLGATNEPGGFIQSLRAWPERPEIVGLVRLPAWPSGRATRETFAWLMTEIDEALAGAGRLDGVLFALHGGAGRRRASRCRRGGFGTGAATHRRGRSAGRHV
ncbi:MAG: M81 family metallopeptidase [Pirellulales bacterium]